MPSTIFSGQKIKTLKDTLTLNGKSDIISSTVDPTASAVDAPIGSLLINQTSGKLYRKLDAGSSVNWEDVGAGVGGINYILNPSAEVNTTGWATYADAAGAAPVDGTGGSPNVTWTRSTTSPLRGVADFNFVKDAANRQGQGVSYDFTIDEADKAKVLSVTFDYEVLSGTYADGDLTVYLIADPTGTPVVIQPAGYTVSAATVGTTMREVATFQTQATGTSYRLCFHVASTSASAYTLAIDNVVVGPQQTVQGAAISDFKSYSVTVTTDSGTMTNYNATGFFSRIGDHIVCDVAIKFTGAPGTWSGVKFSIPPGLSFDTNKMTTLSDITEKQLGFGTITDTGTIQYDGLIVYSSANTARALVYATTVASYATATNLTQTIPFTFVSGDVMQFRFSAPIQGWSSNTVLSQDTDTRLVAARVAGNATGTIATTFGSSTALNFGAAQFDSHGSWSGSAYVVPVSGNYRISGLQQINAASGQTFLGIGIYIGSSLVRESIEYGAAATADTVSFSHTLNNLNAGDQISFRAISNGTTPVTAGGVTVNNIYVERLSGPATIAASETVAMRAYKNTGNHTSTGAWQTVASWNSSPFDTHGAFNITTGEYTVPVSGTYQVSAHIAYLSNITGARGLRIDLDGSVVSGGSFIAALNGFGTGIPATSLVRALAGQKISLSGWQNGAASLGYETILGFNQFSIVRVGN